MIFKVPPEGGRIDDLVGNKLEIKAKHTKPLFLRGSIYLGKRRCKDHKVKPEEGEEIKIYNGLNLSMPEDVFDSKWIVYQDDDILVISKPAGMPSQGTRMEDFSSLYETLKRHMEGYIGMMHRLDMGTSGLLVFSRSKRANKPLSALITNHELMIKKYLCVVVDDIKIPDFVEQPLGVIAGSFPKKHGVKTNGKFAKTGFTKWLKNEKNMQLLQARLFSGRTHQIRIHLQFLGSPILGDTFYGGQKWKGSPLLHCYTLEFPHPITHKSLKFTSPIPQRILDLFPGALA